jgi:hypothetical protein
MHDKVTAGRNNVVFIAITLLDRLAPEIPVLRLVSGQIGQSAHDLADDSDWSTAISIAADAGLTEERNAGKSAATAKQAKTASIAVPSMTTMRTGIGHEYFSM